MKRLIATCVLALCMVAMGTAQPNYNTTRQQETLQRALTAVPLKNGKTFLSWRYFENDNQEMRYELYKNGVKIGSFKRTNYLYPAESNSSDEYELRVVDAEGNVVESTVTTPWANDVLRIPLNRPTSNSAASSGLSYTPNDCSIGDIDGDGVMEIFVKWDPSTSKDNSQSGKTDNVLIDCYRLDGTFVWRVDLGPNIRAGAHYTQFLVYDFDGDGKAELMCKTGPWSKDGVGKYVSAAATDDVIKNQTKNTQSYRDSNGYIKTGPEFLTVFSGVDGHAIHTTWYNPNRAGNFNQEDSYPSSKSFWGDDYANRSERHLAAVAYLNGEKPSGVFARGYYTRAYVWAVDFDGTQLVHRWLHASVSNTDVEHYDANWTKTTKTYSSNTSGVGSHFTLYGNGNHNMTVGDVDGDGKDEIIWGSGALDDDGQLLYSVGFGHGDAIHMGTLNPERPGLQVFDIHEDKGTYAWDIHDAATGEVLFKGGQSGQDNGRGVAADIIGTSSGYEFWSSYGGFDSASRNQNPFSAVTGQQVGSKKPSMNFRIYWDDDLLDELFDGGYFKKDKDGNYTTELDPALVTKYKNGSFAVIETMNNHTCNTTKQTPNLLADLFGDWREEVILHDDDALYVYTTSTLTDYVVPCLLTDHIYRMAIAWQQTAYNQPPHLGYYLPTKAILIEEDDETILPDDYEQEYEESQVTILWTLNNGTIDEEPVITFTDGSPSDISTNIALGSLLQVSGTGTITGGLYTETKFKSLEKRTASSAEQTVTFSISPSDEWKFKPTGVSFIATRFGTNGGALDIVWKTETDSKTCDSNLQPLRNNDYTSSGETVNQSPYYSSYSYNPGTDYSGGTSSLCIPIYKLDANKEIGLCEVTITGMLRKPIPYVPAMPTPILSTAASSHHPSPTPLFNIMGQRVNNQQSLPSGIYIRQGRKFVVK